MPHVRRPVLALLLALLWSLGLTSTLAQASPPTAPAHAHDDAHDDAHDHVHDDPEDDAHDEDHADAHAGDDHGQEGDHGDAHDHHAHAAGVAGTRLLVAEADGPRLLVLDLEAGVELARFGTPGPGTVHRGADGQFAFVLHRAADRVTVVHSGLTVVDHGDHADLVEGLPYVVQTVNLGPEPSGFFARGVDVAIFHAGDGSVAWLDRRLLGVSLDYAFLAGRGPGGGGVAVVDGLAYVGSHDLGRVDLVDPAGRAVASFDGCPELEAPAAWAGGVAFVCADGVLLVEAGADGAATAHHLAYPQAGPPGARATALVADRATATLVGAFGQGLVRIDPVARTTTAIALPAAPLAMGFAEAGALLVVLTADGVLHALDPATGEVQRSVAVIEAGVAEGARPSLAVLGAHVYVTDPAHDAVVEVHVDAFEVERRLALPFTPGGLVGLAIEGAATH